MCVFYYPQIRFIKHLSIYLSVCAVIHQWCRNFTFFYFRFGDVWRPVCYLISFSCASSVWYLWLSHYRSQYPIWYSFIYILYQKWGAGRIFYETCICTLNNKYVIPLRKNTIWFRKIRELRKQMICHKMFMEDPGTIWMS